VLPVQHGTYAAIVIRRPSIHDGTDCRQQDSVVHLGISLTLTVDEASLESAKQRHGGELRRDDEADYVAFMPKPNAATAVRDPAIAFEHYNEQHPHSALNYRLPRKFRRSIHSSS
jgi:putative transposase